MSLFQRPSRFAVKVNEPVAPTTYGLDHIETYLKEPPIPSSVITDTGGYLKFWSGAAVKRPGLARMGIDFCSTPGMSPTEAAVSISSNPASASSVDAERAFSVGRRQVNFMQHNMASNTFKAKMALGSWHDQPFFPKIQKLAAIIESRSAGETFEGFSSSSSTDSE